MDDLAHDFPVNHRKRKADQDDCPRDDSAEPIVIVPTDVADTPCPRPSTAPRQPCLAPRSDSSIWPQPASPSVSGPVPSQALFNAYPTATSQGPTKRPRLEKIVTALHLPKRDLSRRSALPTTPSRPPTARYDRDIVDIGIISATDPGPSTGSLLNLRSGPKHLDPSSQSPASVVHIDPNSTHIPPLLPLINRQTLRELDLDAILRNPQLRHDLLFDSGLQFRPTFSRRKREISEKYWAAIVQEIESGCTCVSFDLDGKPHSSVVCVCAQVSPPRSTPALVYPLSSNVVTLRMPSRIRVLLTEFLEVLLLVIQPLSTISGLYVNPNAFKSQMQEHSAQASYIRSLFDPALIEQELKHSVFDPSGIFKAIGETLKGHCAPMRDTSVEEMIRIAQSCAPGGVGSKKDAVKAMRMCMDILEFMKLDIANHQLQTLRPYLMRTSGQFELKTFRARGSTDCSLDITREWLCSAHREMLASSPIPHPRHTSGRLQYASLPRNQQLYLAALKGLTDLVFFPPPSGNTSQLISPTTPVSSPVRLVSLPGYPETCYLDQARLVLLASEAGDLAALYMYLLLYRQLVLADSSEALGPQDGLKISDADLQKVKNEIRDLGSGQLGYGLLKRHPSSDGELQRRSKTDKTAMDRWRDTKQDIVLQVAQRAKETQRRSTGPCQSPSSSVPDGQVLNLAQRWADDNLHPDSALGNMLRRRLRDTVLYTVVALAYPGRDSTTAKLYDMSTGIVSIDSSIEIPSIKATGMEPLSDEIRGLSERISRLAVIHLNAYLPLYEQGRFLQRF